MSSKNQSLNKRILFPRLLGLRLSYYKASIFERLWRFKLLLFFVLAVVTPSVALAFQIICMAATAFLIGNGHNPYFLSLLMLQLLGVIWVGSQFDCLKLDEIENYLKTLKITPIQAYVTEMVFCLIVNLPFILVLAVGTCFLTANQTLPGITHFIYLVTSLLYLSICLIFSFPTQLFLLIFTNLILVTYDGITTGLALSTTLLLMCYFIINKPKYFSLTVKTMHPASKPSLSKFFPEVYLNLKTLFVWTKVYTICIFGFNLLILLGFISYALANKNINQLQAGFLIVSNIILFFCALLIYKILEARKSFGEYFRVFHNRMQSYFLDFLSISMVALFFLTLAFSIGLYFGVNFYFLVKSCLISAFSLFIFVTINRQFSFYGPILSLLCLVTILIAAWAY